MPYPDRFALIAARLAGIPLAERTARFRCVLALADPVTGRTATTEGTVEGRILDTPRGAHGFGYDPIFFLPERGVTMAELPAAEKDAISHRGRAARAMAAVLRAWE